MRRGPTRCRALGFPLCVARGLRCHLWRRLQTHRPGARPRSRLRCLVCLPARVWVNHGPSMQRSCCRSVRSLCHKAVIIRNDTRVPPRVSATNRSNSVPYRSQLALRLCQHGSPGKARWVRMPALPGSDPLGTSCARAGALARAPGISLPRWLSAARSHKPRSRGEPVGSCEAAAHRLPRPWVSQSPAAPAPARAPRVERATRGLCIACFGQARETEREKKKD